jgi:hypothetical protein
MGLYNFLVFPIYHVSLQHSGLTHLGGTFSDENTIREFPGLSLTSDVHGGLR